MVTQTLRHPLYGFGPRKRFCRHLTTLGHFSVIFKKPETLSVTIFFHNFGELNSQDGVIDFINEKTKQSKNKKQKAKQETLSSRARWNLCSTNKHRLTSSQK